MNNLAIIGLSVLLCFIAFGIVAGNYITPRLQAWSREDAIKALVTPPKALLAPHNPLALLTRHSSFRR